MDIEDILRQAEHREVVLAKSDWFTDPSSDELDGALAVYAERFEALLPAFVARLGTPDFTDQTDPDLSEEIYGEAMRLAGWRHADGYRLLAFGQHDRETPIFVSFGVRKLET